MSSRSERKWQVHNPFSFFLQAYTHYHNHHRQNPLSSHSRMPLLYPEPDQSQIPLLLLYLTPDTEYCLLTDTLSCHDQIPSSSHCAGYRNYHTHKSLSLPQAGQNTAHYGPYLLNFLSLPTVLPQQTLPSPRIYISGFFSHFHPVPEPRS